MEREQLRAALCLLIGEIEHFGSTSVPGLWAKPTLDILLGTCRWPWPEEGDQVLRRLGYTLYREPGERWRVYLKARGESARGVHLHIVEADSEHWRSHLLFRDYLRRHPDARERYAERKRNLTLETGGARGPYQRLKGGLVSDLMD